MRGAEVDVAVFGRISTQALEVGDSDAVRVRRDITFDVTFDSFNE